MPDNVLTVRERILQQISLNFKNMRKDVDGYNTTFKHVTREPLTPTQMFDVPAISILDINNSITDGVGFIVHLMRVQVDVWATRPVTKTNDAASRALNVLLGDVQRLFLNNLHTLEDVTGERLTMNVQMVSDEFDFGEPDDKRVNTLIEVDVMFRHNKQDPTELKPGGN